MSKWLEKKKDKSNVVLHQSVTPDLCKTRSVSRNDPNDTVTGRSPMSLKINDYHDDIITAGAKKMGISKQQFVRVAFLELAEKLDIF